MKSGTLYGIGVGPGDPELMTVKGAGIISRCKYIFAPKARGERGSTARAIASPYLGSDSAVQELVFPMTTDQDELARHWDCAAGQIADLLQAGEDVCFLTLGDPLLYSTYIYLLRALRTRLPNLRAVTIPGITSFSAAAALTHFPVGKAKEPITVIPTTDDPVLVKAALAQNGTTILMKIGKRLPMILDILEEENLIDQAVFVARAGQEGEQVETDLRKLRDTASESGYLSIILVHAEGRKGK